MGYSATVEETDRKNAVQAAMTTPKNADLPLREMLLSHLTHLVTDHNDIVRAKLHYLATGEITRDEVREIVPYVRREDSRQRTYAENQLRRELLGELSPNLSGKSDAELLKLYGDTLLRLRVFLLPDATPA